MYQLSHISVTESQGNLSTEVTVMFIYRATSVGVTKVPLTFFSLVSKYCFEPPATECRGPMK